MAADVSPWRSIPLSAADQDAIVARAQAAVATLRTRADFGEWSDPALELRFLLEHDHSDYPRLVARLNKALAESVPALAANLSGENVKHAWHCATALAALGPKAVGALPALIQATRHPNTELRTRALDAIKAIAPTNGAALQEFRLRATDPEEIVRRMAVQCLAEAGLETVPDLPRVLQSALDDARAGVREAAAAAAGRLGPAARPLLPRLQEMLADRSKHVRAAASEAVRLIQRGPGATQTVADTRAAVRRAMEMLTHPNAHMRASACEELASLSPNAAAAVPALFCALGDPKASVRMAAAGALRLASEHLPEVRERLVKMLDNPQAELRGAALSALSYEAPTDDLLEPLIRAFQDRSFSGRATAGHMLARYAGSRTGWAEQLRPLLNDPDPKVRAAALQIPALASSSGDPGSPDPALRGLSDPSWNVRLESAVALEKRGTRNAEAARKLAQLMLEDPHDAVRCRAGGALYAVGPAPLELLPALISAIDTPDESNGEWVVIALGQLGPAAEPAVPALMRIAKAGTWLSAAAESALIRIKGEDFYLRHFT